MLLFSLTDPDSLARLEEYIYSTTRANVIVELVGTKKDLSSERQVTNDQANEFMKTQGIEM